MIDEEAVEKVKAYFKEAETMTRDSTAQATLAAAMLEAEMITLKKD